MKTSRAFVLAAVLSLAGCGPYFEDLEKAAGAGDRGSQLALCRAEARAAFYVEQTSEDEAMRRYDACVKRSKL